MPAERKASWSSIPFLIAAVLVAGCRQAPETPVTDNETGEAAAPLPRLPLPEPPMDRAALLTAVAKAASAAALGRREEAADRSLDGKPFELRIRFGCTAGTAAKPVTAATPFSVRFDEKTRTLKVRAAPDLSLDDPKIAARAGETIETVEGFWMHRPWLLSAGCPASAPAPKTATDGVQVESANADGQVRAPASAIPELTKPATAVPPFRVGIAQYFSESDSRTRRRDQRAYEATKLLEADEMPSSQGYDLILAGRLRKLPDGSVISCAVENADRPPECVISATFDRVRIEQPATREVLAQWGA